MLNKKIIILVLCLAVLMVVSGCIKKTEKPAVNNNDQQNIATTADQKTELEQKKEYEGELIKEENGWKRYRNEYWGVEFRFRDEEDEMSNNDMKDGVVIRHNKKGSYIYTFIKMILNLTKNNITILKNI